MIVHVFFGKGGRVGVTSDRSGSSLPVEGAPWVHNKQMDINSEDTPRITANAADIIKAIQEDGFFLVPKKEASGPS